MAQQSDRDLLIEIHTDVQHMKQTISGIPANCATHTQRIVAAENRIDSHDRAIDCLWGRWWWAIGIALTTLLTIIVTTFVK